MIAVDERNGSKVAIINSEDVVIFDGQSALDLIAAAFYEHNCNKIIMKKENICKDFYMLKTGLAGEILQKFSNYGVTLAIVGDFRNVGTRSMRDFINECNRGSQTFFLPSESVALNELHARN